MKLECIVRKFYDELNNGKIMGRRCTACGAVEFPPRIACNECGNFETEWVEMSGDGMVTDIISVSPIANPRVHELDPCAFGVIRLKEGKEINAVVRGVTSENEEELQSKLPLPVKAAIVQRKGYCSVVYDLVKK
ncbi:MAG: zinc ribbon domain-containing protein [Lachnospiraceae bacterium]|nr:zinc ribbon domain-containing protein [Lachnospiraceae bacterium]